MRKPLKESKRKATERELSQPDEIILNINTLFYLYDSCCIYCGIGREKCPNHKRNLRKHNLIVCDSWVRELKTKNLIIK